MIRSFNTSYEYKKSRAFSSLPHTFMDIFNGKTIIPRKFLIPYGEILGHPENKGGIEKIRDVKFFLHVFALAPCNVTFYFSH